MAEWLSLESTISPLMAGDMTGGDAARLAMSMLLWIVIPMAGGVVGVTRKEVA